MCLSCLGYNQQPLSWRVPEETITDSVRDPLESLPCRDLKHPFCPQIKTTFANNWLFKPCSLLRPNPARARNLLQECFSRHRLPSPLTRSKPGSRSTYKAEHLLYLLCQSDLILYRPLGLPEALNEFHLCSFRQYYAYLTDTQCKRVGTQCWVFG